MARRKLRRPKTPATQRIVGSESTVIWGKEVEAEDFVKVPRVLLRLGRYGLRELEGLKPRHLLLLLVLAGRQYQRRPIRAYWEELAWDLDVKKDTVRKWAYELKEKGLLRITQHRGRDPDDKRVGYRNERNSSDISPFVRLVGQAYKIRQKDRARGREGHDER